ncbi:MAG: membrane-associated PAP2 superfamily phosphatase [Alphaproteobacteria bacterium]|jgi:membrane-associated PAP2 superfamily phosphatase
MHMNFATLKRDVFIILGISSFITALSIIFDLDQTFARLSHNPESHFAWLAKEYAPTPFIAISIALLVFILIPPLRKKYPTLNHTALIWLFTLVFGAGLLVHSILKDSVERPRPRTTVILNGAAPYTLPFNLNGKAPQKFHDKSFPSGHVATAAMLLVPFFILRRRKPVLAKAFLSAGILSGVLMGYGRMIYGAHFFTDIVWGIACVALTATIGSYFIKEKTVIKTRYILIFIAFVIFCLAWFNTFTRTIKLTATEKEISFNIPCEKMNINVAPPLTPYKVSVKFSGSGGPKKWLDLVNDNGHISYTTKLGIFHDLSCTATLWIPSSIHHNIPHLNN